MFHWVAAGWLLLCYLAGIIDPNQVPYLVMFSLTTPFALFALFMLTLFCLLAGRKKQAIAGILIIILSFPLTRSVMGYHFLKKQDWSHDSPGDFKLISWNVHAMGIFNPPNEEKHAEGILHKIIDENADIVCLPEYSIHMDSLDNAFANRLLYSKGYTHHRFEMDNGLGPHIQIGTALFSKFPIVHSEVHELSEYIRLLICDVSLRNDQVVRFALVHLHSFGLTDQDKAVIEDAKRNNPIKIHRSKSFIGKFNEAYSNRAKEALLTADLLKSSPYPIILCGDFNDLPGSFTYNTLLGDRFTDAFTVHGKGLGRTYNQIIPTLRIDHIFYEKDQFELKAFSSPKSKWSDHSPVIANLRLKENSDN